LPQLQVKDLTKIYRTNGMEFAALNGVSFAVEPGEFLSIAGPSGSGKTTMLNLIGCLDKPTRGQLLLDGEELSRKSGRALSDIRRYRIGFIFQTFNLVPVLTAFENVEIPLILKGGLTAGERRELVEAILTEVGLKEMMRRRPSLMSGGQQQRVAIARALVKHPPLVLADEPTANLDSRTGRGILALMMELNQRTGATFIFSTHDQMVMDFGRRLIHLQDGMLVGDEKRS
jgi:putative ABC transport system ATP-binding protein